MLWWALGLGRRRGALTVVGVVEVAEGRVVTPAVRRVVPRGHALSATRLKTTESDTCGERQVFLTASHLPCGQRGSVRQAAAKGRRPALCSPLGASSSRQTSAWWPCRSLQRSRELRRRAAAGSGGAGGRLTVPRDGREAADRVGWVVDLGADVQHVHVDGLPIPGAQ